LNHLAKNKTVPVVDRRDKNPANALEKVLLEYQSLEKDPFRLMKISDFQPVGSCRTKIVYAVNAKKVPSKFEARGPFQILEVIQPGAVFSGSIQVLEPLARDAIKTPLSAEKVFESAKVFYAKEKKREDNELKAADLPVGWTDGDGGICQLRIGRHSGAESLTVEGHRHIKIMKKRGEKPGYADKATTFWLASDVPDSKNTNRLDPFGWVSLGPMTQSMKDELEAQAAKQESINVNAGTPSVSKPAAEEKSKLQVAPVEETWESAAVSFNAGGGGVVTAKSTDKKTAEIRGKEKALAATDASLHKKLFDGKKTLPKARVTVRKAGNNWQIVKIEPVV
jgi:CRISPR-associated protein Csm5